ncbi:Uu.00g051910.m01.CDS01 [Anthostomella pinea]|uniref:Uu.00g051910.m01.CDS01 n=1 Tax=Anthostomella pinea TaxID=933095 RepID=A0AAI8VQG8_9PEZI|nr:Uu.00g051910.m01.CDS01 [Anthostomella pinea]
MSLEDQAAAMPLGDQAAAAATPNERNQVLGYFAFPAEIQVQIGSDDDLTDRDILRLSLTCRELYVNLNPCLYKKEGPTMNRALCVGAIQGDIGLLARALSATDNRYVNDHMPEYMAKAWLSTYSEYAGLTAVAVAAKYNQAEAVQYLLAHGADPNKRAAHGPYSNIPGRRLYPIHWALRIGLRPFSVSRCIEIVKTLLDHGADPNQLTVIYENDRYYGNAPEVETPLLQAIGPKFPVRVAQLLLDRGANPNASAHTGRPLQILVGQAGWGSNGDYQDCMEKLNLLLDLNTNLQASAFGLYDMLLDRKAWMMIAMARDMVTILFQRKLRPQLSQITPIDDRFISSIAKGMNPVYGRDEGGCERATACADITIMLLDQLSELGNSEPERNGQKVIEEVVKYRCRETDAAISVKMDEIIKLLEAHGADPTLTPEEVHVEWGNLDEWP